MGIGMPWKWDQSGQGLTLAMVYAAAIMERADEALLPGVYYEVGHELQVSPTALGSLTLLRSLTQAICYPVAASLASHHNRAHVISLGAFLWAAATFLVGISTSYQQVAASRALNGIGLAIVIPAIQSLVADSTHDGNRGLAFGCLQLTGNLGSIVGGLLSVLLAPTTVLGISGWRISFHLVAAISVVVGVCVRAFAEDPRYANGLIPSMPNESKRVSPFLADIKAMLMEAKEVMGIRTFQIIVAQGIVGSFPGSALTFVPMWLELIGFSHKETAFLMGLFVIAGSLGAVFGGYMGDKLSVHLPDAGRIMLAQISSGLGIPLAAVLLLVIPDDPSTGLVHGLMLFIMGFCISWIAAGTNNPIFAEIVPQRQRTSIYALDRSFESVLASFAPPVVGILSQHVFGYKPVSDGSNKAVETETDRKNAAALAEALFTAVGIPKALCCLIKTFLYWSYPKDRDKARIEAQLELEMQQMRIENVEADFDVEIHDDRYGDDGDDDEKGLLGKDIK